MLKQALRRALVSAPACMLINQLVGICISLSNADGRYSPVTPAFAARFESPVAAVVVQLLLIGLIGATFAVCSVLFQIERWSFLKQGLVHLAITSAVGIPICLFCWMPQSARGALILCLSWLFTYVATWLSQYFVYRHRVRALDAKIKAVNGKEPQP